MSDTTARPGNTGPVIIKKYANRRLYNTDSSSYVTLETLAEMVRGNIDFLVVDAKTGDDLTRPTLTQIIVEQESKGSAGGMNLLPVPFLRQLIGMYGDSMQWFVPNYLEQMMRHFTDSQQQWQAMMKSQLDKNTQQIQGIGQNMGLGMLPQQLANPMQSAMQAPLQAMQQVSRQVYDQNRQMLEQAQKAMLSFFMPFATPAGASPKDKATTLNAMKQRVQSLEDELKGLDED